MFLSLFHCLVVAPEQPQPWTYGIYCIGPWLPHLLPAAVFLCSGGFLSRMSTGQHGWKKYSQEPLLALKSRSEDGWSVPGMTDPHHICLFFCLAHHCGAFIQKHSSIVTIFLSLTHSHVFVWFFPPHMYILHYASSPWSHCAQFSFSSFS